MTLHETGLSIQDLDPSNAKPATATTIPRTARPEASAPGCNGCLCRPAGAMSIIPLDADAGLPTEYPAEFTGCVELGRGPRLTSPIAL